MWEGLIKMNRRKIDALNTTKEHQTFYMLVEFAHKNNLELFDVKGSLYDRVRTITSKDGACPCYKERTRCPCKECIQEVKDKGECGCRVFVSKRR